ncbi:MAG: helix-turn-helix domain-containing protein [Acidobacteriota bacterium]
MKRLNEMTFYELLNLQEDASPQEIQEAYRLAMATYQPGSLATYTLVSEDERQKILGRIEEAFRELSHPLKRHRYDQKLHPEKLAKPQESCSEGGQQQEEPEENEYSLSSGQYLKSVRNMKGLSLKRISEDTKVSIRYLEALEGEDYGKLPQGAYLGFILGTYARALNLDPQSVVQDFKSRQLASSQ